MWAYATPPGGMVATFIESFVEPTFFADSPTLYRMLFQPRQESLPRTTWMPSPASTNCERSSSRTSVSPIGTVPPHLFGPRFAPPVRCPKILDEPRAWGQGVRPEKGSRGASAGG